MVKLSLILILFSVNVFGADLSTTAEARARVYGLLGLDTTGATNLPTNVVDEYVYVGVHQINMELGLYLRDTLFPSVDGQRFYNIDSIIRIITCHFVLGDSLIMLTPVEGPEDRVFEDASNYGYSQRYDLVGDSIWLIPNPKKAETYFLVYNAITKTISDLKANYRMGVVYWAASLAADDIGEDGTKYMAKYDRFIGLVK